MRLGKKANLSQEHTDKEQLAPEVVADKPKKKRQIFSFWGVATILGIFGTLGFIALPSFLNCANPAKQVEAKTYIGTMNRGQQAYFLEKNTFANSVESLDIGITTQTFNYNYSIRATKMAVFQYGIARNETLKSYVGGVFVIPSTANKSEPTTISILCEAFHSGLTPPNTPTLVKGIPTCGDYAKKL